MIAKLTKGRGFRGALAYLLEGSKGTTREGACIVGGNMSGIDVRQLAAEFGVLRKLRPTLGKAVCHASISLSPQDRRLTDADLDFIARRFVLGMGYEECPFVVVRHEDTAHQHIHIVASRINTRCEVVSDAHDYKRAEKIMRELEEAYLLHSPTESLNQRKEGTDAVDRPQSRGAMTMKDEIRRAVDEAVREAKNMKGFVAACEARGVETIPNISGRRVCGFAFRRGGVRVKGSSLGPMYTWDALRQRLDYQEEEDLPILLALSEVAAEPLACMVCPDIESAQQIRHEARRTLDEHYTTSLAKHFPGEEVEFVRVSRVLELRFKSGGRLYDYGQRVEADDPMPSRAAKRMIAMAKAKGWMTICLSGGEAFLRSAMREALAAGLTVLPRDAWQQAIIDEIKLVQAGVEELDSDGPNGRNSIQARMDALREAHKRPAEETSKPRPRRPTM